MIGAGRQGRTGGAERIPESYFAAFVAGQFIFALLLSLLPLVMSDVVAQHSSCACLKRSRASSGHGRNVSAVERRARERERESAADERTRMESDPDPHEDRVSGGGRERLPS